MGEAQEYTIVSIEVLAKDIKSEARYLPGAARFLPTMKNPYSITEPTAISFSGGRTSAYMLWKCIEAHDGKLPNEAVVTFANTGKEMPQTLDFVQACSEHWEVDIVWLERFMRPVNTTKEGNKYSYEMKIVDYASASRNGEPFASLTQRPYLPNPVARFCTKELKVEAIKEYMKSIGAPSPYNCLIGIRADETRRAVKIHNSLGGGQDRYCPLYVDGVTAADVGRFWKNQPFDLNLPNNNGVTDWGNCDLCFLKGRSIRMSIIRERPELADWWAEQEAKVSAGAGRGSQFRADEPSYAQMKVIATDQPNLFDFGNDESISCFCGD